MLNSNLKNLLVEAMISEKKSKEFYIEASKKAQSKAGKNFFKELADFEENHYSKVKKIIESLDKGIKIKEEETESNTNKVSPEVKGEFEPNRDEIVNIINLAIEAEKDAQDRYMKISKVLTVTKEKNIFKNLANEESNHKRMLEHQFYQISNKGTIIWE